MVTAIYGVEFLNCPDCSVHIEGANASMIGIATAGHAAHASGSQVFFFKDRQDFEANRVAVFEGRNRFAKPIPFVDFKTSDGQVFKDLQEAFEHENPKFVLPELVEATPENIAAAKASGRPFTIRGALGGKSIQDMNIEPPPEGDAPINFEVETIHTRIAAHVRENKATRAAGIAEALGLTQDEVEAAIADEKSQVVKGTAAWIKLKE